MFLIFSRTARTYSRSSPRHDGSLWARRWSPRLLHSRIPFILRLYASQGGTLQRQGSSYGSLLPTTLNECSCTSHNTNVGVPTSTSSATPTREHDRDWQHLWIRRTASLQRGGVVPKHSWISRTASHRSSSTLASFMVRAFRTKCFSVQHAPSRCTSSCCCRTSCSWSHGCWESCRVHGSHPELPRASWKTKNASRRLGWVQSHEGYRIIFDR